jgi:SAM-dependent methyltransferase
MDAAERLSPDDLARPGYLAASHVHRYAIAAELCAGLRVADLGCGIGYGAAALADRGAQVIGIDNDPRAVALARQAHGGDSVTFDVGDVLTFLRRPETATLDGVVMFEALEHVADREDVLAELERLAAAGVRLVLSVPNSRTFREDNPHHLTDFSYSEARRAFDRFERVEWLYQHLAEGSLILPEDADDGDALQARVEATEQAEPEYANTFIAAVGFEPGAARRASAVINVVATPSHNRYMLELERSNREFWDSNRQLWRTLPGKHDAAAAAVLARFDERIAELEGRAWILGEEKRIAEAKLAQMTAWHDAGRYHAVDRAVAVIRRTPVVYPAAKGARRVLRYVRRQH